MPGPSKFEHALIVGGTGMLAAATRVVVARSETATLVARDEAPMRALTAGTTANFVAVDYTDVDAFIASLQMTRALSGDFDIVIAWLHTVGDPALNALAPLLGEQRTSLRFVHVIGSRGTAMPRPALGELAHISYQRVLLGHLPDDDGDRWLTHDEISGGVVEALETRGDVVVGVLS